MEPIKEAAAENQAAENEASNEGSAPAREPSSQEIQKNEFEKKVETLQAQVKEKEDKYLYLYADFENYKKRTSKERSEQIKFGWEPLAHDLLQIMDNLERAQAHIPPGTDKAMVDGLNMVLNQFGSTLQRQNVQPIESLNKPFDPNLHEAVGAEPSEQPAGTIIREQLGGYTLHGRLLRPARVIVSEGKK